MPFCIGQTHGGQGQRMLLFEHPDPILFRILKRRPPRVRLVRRHLVGYGIDFHGHDETVRAGLADFRLAGFGKPHPNPPPATRW